MKTLIKIIIPILIVFALASCATVPAPIKPGMGIIPQPLLLPPVMRQDIMHIVAPGETLWRISKIYDVDVKKIMRENKLTEAEKLIMGQKLLIPQALPPSPLVTLYPSYKWRYIIIHHSATDEGSALLFFKAHLRRGFNRGLGYHFVIDNGTSDKPDGYIEISPRWINQQDGAHCEASGMNYKSIGICLVGNFDKERISDKQLSSLVWLVNLLRKYYQIPLKNIMGHGQVPRAKTECPGRNFPWSRFLSELEKEKN